jgi:hypothetical protein
MPRNRIVSHFFFSFFILAFVNVFAIRAVAQTGKIAGKITDAKTGEPLLKASIQILETKQGALSKDNGVATIINVAPREDYTVIAKYAGYQPITIKNVKVVSDQTTQLTFKLSSKTQDTIIVSTDRLVDVTKIGINDKFSAKQIQTIAAVQNIRDVAALTPGLIPDGSNGGFSIHGSRGTENSEKLNGVETMNPVLGTESISQLAISKFAISEIGVTTSGGGAALSGTTGGQISTQTRAGASSFEFMLRYRQDLPSLNASDNGIKQMGANDHEYELAVGGPITEDMKFFITAKGVTQQYHSADINPFSLTAAGIGVLDPAGNNLGHLPNDNYYLRGATANLSFDALGFHFSADGALNSRSRQGTSFVSSGAGWAWAYGDPAEIPGSNTIDNIYTLNASTGIGQSGILKLTAGYESYGDHIGKYDQSQGGGLFSLYKIYQAQDNFSYDDANHIVTPGPDGIVDIYTPVSKQVPDPSNPANIRTYSGAGINPFTGHIEGDGIFASTQNPYGLYGYFLAAGNVFGFTNQTYDQYTLQGGYSDQFGSHGIDFGFEGHLYNIQNYNNGLPWDANPFKDSFTVVPIIAGVYVQDKMEFSDITFQPGLRFDYYNPRNDRALVDPFNPFTDTIINGVHQQIPKYKQAPVQALLSPRLGITYAVSDKTTFNFNYGIYYKQPLFTEVLSATGGSLSEVLARGNNILGNAGLKGENDENLSVGFETGLSDVLRMTVNGIYRKMRNISGLERITSPNLALGYSIYTDDEYANYKGLELTIEKRMSDNYSMKFNYTYSTTLGTASSALSNYSSLINQAPDAEFAVLPLQPFPVDWDRTHVAQLLLTALFAKGEGPKIGGTPILEHFIFSTKTIFETGTPYTALTIKGTQAGDHNAEREPSYFQTDLTITRNILFSDVFGGSGNTSLDIQFEVFNLFNAITPIAVYATSGQGDDDGLNHTYIGTQDYINNPTDPNQYDQLGLLKYNPRWDLNKDGRVSIDEQAQAYKQYLKDNFARRTNYQVPRRIYMNFALHF